MEGSNKKDIEEKIKNCQAVKSMLEEMRISSKMKTLQWSVTDNPYYEDAESGKFRELDVFGRLGLDLRNRDLYYEFELLVESKSVSNYHILFSNSDRFISSDLDTDWLGEHIQKGSTVFSVLQQAGFSANDIRILFKKVRSKFYPSDYWIFADFQYSFFKKIESFYSFRETNVGVVKELNNSVVWKSFQELLTVNKSIRKRHLDNMLGDLQYYIEQKIGETPIDSAFDCLQNYLSRITYIHPVLVVDGNLWKIDVGGTVSSIPYARLLQADLFGINYFWIDIVNRKNFDVYIEAVTDHTQRFCEHLLQKANTRMET